MFKRQAQTEIVNNEINIQKVHTCNIEILNLGLSCFVSHSLIVNDKVVGDGELVVRISTQERIVYFMFTNTELVTDLPYRFRVDNATVLSG